MIIIMNDECAYTCEFCGQIFCRPCAYAVHKRGCSKNPSPKTPSKDGGWSCRICHNVFRTRRDMYNHIVNDHNINTGHAWNKGLTKETNESVAKMAETRSNNITSGKIKYYSNSAEWSLERRQAQSERKKLYYMQHPEKHPNAILAGNRGKMTYPEQVVYDWLISHSIHVEHNKQIKTASFTRYVDFFMPNFNLIIEVDGEYWHASTNDVDHKKDIEALAAGYSTLRIIPKKCIINQLELYFNDKISCGITPLTAEQINKYDLRKDQINARKMTFDEAAREGKLTADGRICHNKITNDEMSRRKDAIINSGVDLSKFGWVEKVSKTTGLTRRQIYKVVNSTDLINYVYRR